MIERELAEAQEDSILNRGYSKLAFSLVLEDE